MGVDLEFIGTALWELLQVLPRTLLITIVPLAVSIVTGTVIALIRMHRVRYLHRIASFYVSFVRGTPMILHVMIIYYLIPNLLRRRLSTTGRFGRDIPLLVFIFVSFSITARVLRGCARRASVPVGQRRPPIRSG